jgi:hypothetical protein
MIAAAHVNVHYLLILLLPLLVGLVALALTWYSRAKRRREAETRRVSRATGTRKSGVAGKPRGGNGANGRSATGVKSRSGNDAKRRR